MIVGGQACWEERQTMDIQEILQQFAANTGTFPREAVAQAIAQREAIIPELIRILAEAQHNIEHLSDSDSMAHIYAMYLLAQFREPRAYPLIVVFFSVPGESPWIPQEMWRQRTWDVFWHRSPVGISG